MSAALQTAQLRLLDSSFGLQQHGPSEFAQLPYRREPYCRRNWGHPFHSMCSYPSKIKPGIAHFLVRLLSRPGESILDPFCGVGTIPFEACNQGRFGLGSDLNPLAAIVTQAKVAPPSRPAVDALISDLAEAVSSAPPKVEVHDEIKSFFHSRTLAEITATRAVLLDSVEAGEGERSAAAAFLLACLAHILHGNRPYALSRRSHNVIPIPPKGDFVYKPLLPSLTQKVDRLLSVPLSPHFLTGSAARLSYAAAEQLFSQVDHVMTSPPFLGTTHFVRQNRVRLWLCGWDYAAQEEARPTFLEHQHGLEPYKAIFTSLAKIIKLGGSCVLHLGVVRDVDMARAISPFAVRAGFAIEDIIYEDATHLESHGRTDRGGTHRHQFLLMRRQ